MIRSSLCSDELLKIADRIVWTAFHANCEVIEQ